MASNLSVLRQFSLPMTHASRRPASRFHAGATVCSRVVGLGMDEAAGNMTREALR